MGRSPHFRTSVPPREGDPHDQLAWRRLRREIADLHRGAEVGRRATERYLDVLASIDQDTTLETVLHRLGQVQYWRGRRVRALHPFAPDDRQLLQAVPRGEFTLNGFRKRDLQRLSFRSASRHATRSPPTLSLGQSPGILEHARPPTRIHATPARRDTQH